MLHARRLATCLLVLACTPSDPRTGDPAASTPTATQAAAIDLKTQGEVARVCNAHVLAPAAPALPFVDRYDRTVRWLEGQPLGEPARPLLAALQGPDLPAAAALLHRRAADVGLATCGLAVAIDEVLAAEPNARTADHAFKVLEAIHSVSPGVLGRILAAGCSEIPSCARACTVALRRSVDQDDTAAPATLAAGCPDFRNTAGPAPTRADLDAWTRARFIALLDATRPHRSPAQEAEVTRMRADLGWQ